MSSGSRYDSTDSSDTESIPEIKLTKCQKYKQFFYNKEDKTIFQKKPKYWGIILIYYPIFLIVIAGFFLGYYYISSYFIIKSEETNKYTIVSGKNYPVITLFPTTENSDPGPIIWLSPKNRKQGSYVAAITKMFEKQSEICLDHNIENCPFNKSSFGPCSTPDYAYKKKKPCMFVKLNSRGGWAISDYKRRKKDKNKITAQMDRIIDANRETIWVHCSGKSGYDKEKLGKIYYYPEQGYSDSYFPFKKGVKFQPMIAIYMPAAKRGFIIEINCSMFIKKIMIDNYEARASLFIDWRD